MRLSSKAIVSGMAALLLSCEDPPRPRPGVRDASPSASSAPRATASAPASAPPREGCARGGSMVAAVADESCVVTHVEVDAVRASMRQLALHASIEPPELLGGGAAVVTITIENTSPTEASVYLEAIPRRPGPRIDWSRVSGVPVPVAPPEAPRLFFPMTTLDAKRRDVDALPTLKEVEEEPHEPTALLIRLRPGGKLTHHMSWWAYRIPAPLPIVKDDAGRHRYTPKTSAVALSPGEYTIDVDLPLHGLSPEERRLSVPIRVVRGLLPDGGVRR